MAVKPPGSFVADMWPREHECASACEHDVSTPLTPLQLSIDNPRPSSDGKLWPETIIREAAQVVTPVRALAQLCGANKRNSAGQLRQDSHSDLPHQKLNKLASFDLGIRNVRNNPADLEDRFVDSRWPLTKF